MLDFQLYQNHRMVRKNLLKWVWLLVVIVSLTQCITRTRVSVRDYLDSAGLWAQGGQERYHLDETNWGEKTWSLWEPHSLYRGFLGCRKQTQCRHACADLLLYALDCVCNLSNCLISYSVISPQWRAVAWDCKPNKPFLLQLALVRILSQPQKKPKPVDK